jgi:hypothetical protein
MTKIVLEKVLQEPFHAIVRGSQAERGLRMRRRTFQQYQRQFPLENVTSESLAAIMNGANLIGVDPGMKSLVTAVRSDNPRDNIQLTAGN